MPVKPRDPLLATARFLLGVAMAVSVGAGAISAVLAPLTYAWRAKVAVYVNLPGAPDEVAQWICAMLLLGAMLAALGFFFFRHLYRIVETVGEGDPFVPVNAGRLAAMGWISLAAHLFAVPMTAIMRWIDSANGNVRIALEIPLSGLLLAVVLFVLARVFREGARMREELEGTV